MGKTCRTYGQRRGAYRALVGKPEGRRPLGRPRRKQRIILKLIFGGVAWGGGGIDWIDLDVDRDRWWRAVVNAIMSVWVPQNAENFLSS
jgi:hypothetical protein